MYCLLCFEPEYYSFHTIYIYIYIFNLLSFDLVSCLYHLHLSNIINIFTDIFKNCFMYNNVSNQYSHTRVIVISRDVVRNLHSHYNLCVILLRLDDYFRTFYG